MTASRSYINRGYRNERNFDDIDDARIPNQRVTPVVLRPNDLDYQPRERERDIIYVDRSELLKSKKSKPKSDSNVCSKRCVLGLIIGLIIGLLICAAVVLPVVFFRKCPTQVNQVSSTPNWVGSYQMDSSCDTTKCCCLTNNITISQAINNQMSISGGVTGTCTGFSSPISIVVPMSTTFNVNFLWGYETIRIVLGQDNSFLALINVYHGMCSATAFRSSASTRNQKSMTRNSILFTLLIATIIMK